MEKTKLIVSKKRNQKNKQLRREGLIPANMYQAGKESIALELNNNVFSKLIRDLNENAILYLQIDGSKEELPVLIDDIQYDVFGKNILHVVFRKINLAEKIFADVAIELVGEFDVPDGVLVVAKDSVEVEALPTDVPASFSIDQGQLKAIGDRITLASLVFDPSKVTMVLNEDEKPEDVVLVLVQEKAEEEVEETASDELVEPELVGAKAETETETQTQENTKESENKNA
jgi:large subunit ribosomal protein L25